MKIATEELRKLADHANGRLLRVMSIDADMIAALAAELITARETLEETLEEWKASQHYSYIGADGKTVKARDLEDELITARAKLEAAEKLAEAARYFYEYGEKDRDLLSAIRAWEAVK